MQRRHGRLKAKETDIWKALKCCEKWKRLSESKVFANDEVLRIINEKYYKSH